MLKQLIEIYYCWQFQLQRLCTESKTKRIVKETRHTERNMANKIVWNVLLFGALIGAALFMYAEKVKQTFVNRYEASNSRQRRDTDIDYYDADIDDDLEMHTTSYASESTTEAPKQKSKLTYGQKEHAQMEHCVAPAVIE